MRIRNRSQSFSVPSSSLSPDLSLPSRTKYQNQQQDNQDQHEPEEEKVHLNRDKKELHRNFYSHPSLLTSHSEPSPSNQAQLLEITSSCMLITHQGDFEITGKEGGEEIWIASDKRSKISGAQTNGFQLSSQVGAGARGARWSEGESTFPLKKRKKKYEFLIGSSTEKKKKEEDGDDDSISDDDDDDDDESVSVKKVKKNKNKNKKKDNSKSGVLEGSRCSRVNGRGWRCCQATLVGYSLCEHHLGKGRLRSINNGIRQCSSNSKRMGLTVHKKKQFLSEEEREEGEEEEEEEEEEVEKKKKKKKKGGGIVKARSMSSLLGQIEEEATTTRGNMLS